MKLFRSIQQQLTHKPILPKIARRWKPLRRFYLRRWRRLLQQKIPRRKVARSGISRPVLLLLAIVLLTSAIGHRFYNEPQLAVNTIAPQTLRAPASAQVEDTKTTAEHRLAARTGSTPVLMVDETANQEIQQALQRYFNQGNELRAKAGSLPFAPPFDLSMQSQQYLRQATDADWQTILQLASGASDAVSANLTPVEQFVVLELQSYRRNSSAEEFASLQKVIDRVRQRYAAAVAAIATQTKDDPQALYTTSLLDLSDEDWEATQFAVQQALDRILIQGIAPGLPDTQFSQIAQAHLIDVPPAGQPIATAMLTQVLQPNLVQDPEQTRLRAEQAAQSVKPEIVKIRQGEIIVAAGDRISQSDFVLLDYFNLSRRSLNGWAILGFTGLVSAAVVIFIYVERYSHSGLRKRDYLLVLLLALSAPLTVMLSLPTTSLPAIALLLGSFYGSALGATTVLLLSLLLPIGLPIGSSALVASSIGSIVGALLAGKRRSREELALLGGAIGLTQGVLYLLLNVLDSPVWYSVLMAALMQALLGVAWSVVAIGLSPYLEHVFDLVTPIRLAELSNPNCPLLKKLAAQTPGTFQHTLFVATLAEAAARSLRCNVELVRAGTLYHDIGKMHDPQGFIENQMGGVNKHDLIDDPWQSAAIIKKHVTEGLAIARRYRLPTAVQAFIPEHQGTMTIAYFHHQAQRRAQEHAEFLVDDSDFRYDGPIPQSRETGIVMLADSCEAALRSLKEATPEEALAMVNRVLRARWQDEQLVESGLTRAEMSQIAEIFVRVWQQSNHQRIPYPKARSA
ncbi:HDIG domain-containing protein [Microcoleus sp. FACHB-1515]|uniref:HD family phosphohydrolase n=1 Tax=Cyanophyceae TaxID=3028117 RepID=UPI00168939E2|nr:HDIG domain-containing metalloprotein [Microcoleus sp. FACHB-1515]MBD2092308.1 HDIG domain-containing protein [Microcoleus sp. FACHB-1515]